MKPFAITQHKKLYKEKSYIKHIKICPQYFYDTSIEGSIVA